MHLAREKGLDGLAIHPTQLLQAFSKKCPNPAAICYYIVENSISMNSENLHHQDSRAELVGLLTRNQRKIFAYIYTLVPHRADAEDILQETSMTIYEKFAEFDPGTDFVAWANRIAWWKVKQAQQKFARSKVVFNEEVMEAVMATAGTMEEEMSDRHEALGSCLKKLNERDRRMVLTRYESGSGVERAAAQAGRSLQAAYKALGRIRQLLLDCVTNEVQKLGVRS